MNEDLLEKVKNLKDHMQKQFDERKPIHTVALPPEPIPDRMHNVDTFPDLPVDPEVLASKVTEKLHSFGNTVPTNTPNMVRELCKSFNECIRLNNINEGQTLILSPKTGSAKSVSSQMYVSLLQMQASIIVVYTIEDAIETCKNINDWSGNNNYARCTYKISDDNKVSDVRVSRGELSKYRCIVISHALFKLSNDGLGINFLSTYKNHKREFVLIDERLDLYKDVTFPLKDITSLLKLSNDIKDSIPIPIVNNEIEYLNKLKEDFTEIGTQQEANLGFDSNGPTIQYDLKSFIHFNSNLRKAYNFTSYDFSNFYKLLDDNTINLQKVIDPLSLFGSEEMIKIIKGNIREHLDNLSTILKYNFYYFAQTSASYGPVIMVTKNILNDFGSSVVLDATASVNALYADKVSENPDTVKHIETTNPRKYQNFTINQCRGVPQGKSGIYKALAPKEFQSILNLYKDIAYSIIKNPIDKLLIIAHKTFKESLEKKIKRKAIEFTHWGDHRGKNKWSHCNKILVIGWNYLPYEVHYINYINSVNGVQNLTNEDFKNIKYNYSGTQIVDDLVQAVNRGAVRKTISIDGNCTESEVFMFYPNSTFGNDVMETFIAEFEGAKVLSWKPVGIEEIQSLAKSYANIERVVDYIQRKVFEVGEIKQSIVQSYFDDATNPERLSFKESRMPKSTVSNAMKHTEFELLLKTKNIHRLPLNSKSFIFKKID